MLKLTCIMLFALIRLSQETDPIFKFIPKQSLLNLPVQSVPRFDIEMVVGTLASPAIFRIHGPMRNGHAGMTVNSFEVGTKGSNFYAPDSQTAVTQMNSTASDGLFDFAEKKFASVKRVDNARTVVADNTLKLTSSLTVVDNPGATSSDKMWVWTSVELGDEYVFVSEEATTVARNAQDRPYLNYNITADSLDPFFPGIQLTIMNDVKHHSSSRINAYEVVLRYYLPPYLEFVPNSYGYNVRYSMGELTTLNQNNQNEVVIKYRKIGITDKPSNFFDVRFRDKKLNLLSRQRYNASIELLISYCSVAGCKPNGAIQMLKQTIKKTFLNREKIGIFKIQHVQSGRCFSFTNGANSNRIIFKATCSDYFTFDDNGGLKHVPTSSCAYVDTDGSLKMSSSKCNGIDVAIIVRGRNAKLQVRYPNASIQCFSQLSNGVENAAVFQGSCSSNNVNFIFIPSIEQSARITMPLKMIMYDSASTMLFGCKRQNLDVSSNCFFRNGSTIWQVLPVSLGLIEAYDPSASIVYGVHRSGKSYVRIELMSKTRDVVQITDDEWNTVKSQKGLITATKLTQASLSDSPVQHLTTNFAVSLTGIYEKVNSVWKKIARW